MNKPSTWLALVAAVVYVGVYWYSLQSFETIYAACVKDQPGGDGYCACQRESMTDEVSLYRLITSHSREMERVKQLASAACVRRDPPRLSK